MKSIMFAIGLAGIGRAVAFALLRTENPKENDAMNSLMVIVPYKYEGLWVFDDAAVGLSKEPFTQTVTQPIPNVISRSRLRHRRLALA
jgi:hypothetical protein